MRLQSADVLLLNESIETHARRQQPSGGVVDIRRARDPCLDQVIRFVQYGVLQAIDQIAYRRLVEAHRILAGRFDGIRDAIDQRRRRLRAGHDFDHGARVRRHEVVQADKALGSDKRTRESNQIEARCAGGDNQIGFRESFLQLPVNRLLGLDVLGRKFDRQVRYVVA